MKMPSSNFLHSPSISVHCIETFLHNLEGRCSNRVAYCLQLIGISKECVCVCVCVCDVIGDSWRYFVKPQIPHEACCLC